jgi:hypothetical protein
MQRITIETKGDKLKESPQVLQSNGTAVSKVLAKGQELARFTVQVREIENKTQYIIYTAFTGKKYHDKQVFIV